jgi:hypothetical protein
MEMIMKPTIMITKDQVKGVIDAQRGKFFTAIFVGKDRHGHDLNGRTGVHKYAKGGPNHANRKPELLTAFNVKKMAYRNVNLPGVTEIRANQVIYKVI